MCLLCWHCWCGQHHWILVSILFLFENKKKKKIWLPAALWLAWPVASCLVLLLKQLVFKKWTVRGRSYELSTWYSTSTFYLVVSYHIPPPPLIYRLSSDWSYLWMFYDVLRCSINHLFILLVTIVTGRLWRPMCIKVAAGDFRSPAF